MPAEIYNANPTIFVPTKSLKASGAQSLWMDDLNPSSMSATDEDEPIDADEIFGIHFS